MLRACRRVLRPGGCIAFYTIFIAEGLPEADYRRAARSGPLFVTSRRRGHRELLRAARFVEIAEIDLTVEFLRTARGWYEGRQRYATELAEAEGESSFRERQADSLAQLKALEAGLLRRSLFVARRH